mgnify:CR=1 FL=1
MSGVSKNEKDKAPPGTLFWMAPEVVGGLEYTRKSDVYSYAIIMWEVFTRLEPYYVSIDLLILFLLHNINLVKVTEERN